LVNPYGDGRAASRIVERIAGIDLDDALLISDDAIHQPAQLVLGERVQELDAADERKQPGPVRELPRPADGQNCRLILAGHRGAFQPALCSVSSFLPRQVNYRGSS